MSEQNKDKLDRENWVKHPRETSSNAESGFPDEKSVDDWEAIARRGRSLLQDEAEAAALLQGIDEAIGQQFGEGTHPITEAGKTSPFRWLSIAASILFTLLIAWWLWPKTTNDEQLYATYFTHLDNDLSVNLMGDTNVDELTEALRPYNARRYTDAAQRIGDYLDRHAEPAAIRLYYGISLLESGSVREAIDQLKQFKNTSTNSNNYVEATDWYLALAYLRSDQQEAASLLLQSIANTQHPYAAQAKALLQAL